MVLNDGQTWSSLDGCKILLVSDEAIDEGNTNEADDFHPQSLIADFGTTYKGADCRILTDNNDFSVAKGR